MYLYFRFNFMIPRTTFIQLLFGIFFLKIIPYTESSLGTIQIDEFLQVESDMIIKMKSFITQERERLQLLRRHTQEWKEWRDLYSHNQDTYITIPTNIFHMFKRLFNDFPAIEQIMLQNSYDDVLNNDDVTPPTNEHLKKVILSLIELRYMYDLKPEDILRGITSKEICLFIGETCWENNRHLCAVEWLNMCMALTSDQEEQKKIYKLLYQSYLFLDEKTYAYQAAEHYTQYDPLDVSANGVVLRTRQQLNMLQPYEVSILESHRLCSDAEVVIAEKNFKCRYNYENSPFLKLAPLKEEQLYDDPKILLYRDAVYDSEIEYVKAWAVDKMQTASVFGQGDDTRITGFLYRIGQSAFLDNRSSFLTSLTNRLVDISELSIDNSEWWQVINYSPGGFYRLHSDFLPSDSTDVKKHGNRMTSVLFYLNDVPLGGRTVFPGIKLAVSASKGSALVWHNLLADGTQDPLTWHSACPVILGEKWAFTQWFRAIGRQCLRHVYEICDESSKQPNQRKVIRNATTYDSST